MFLTVLESKQNFPPFVDFLEARFVSFIWFVIFAEKITEEFARKITTGIGQKWDSFLFHGVSPIVVSKVDQSGLALYYSVLLGGIPPLESATTALRWKKPEC